MNHTVRNLAVLGLTLAAFLTPSVASAATNLLTNPGFEQGLAGWHPTNGQMKLAAPHTGKYSLQLYGAAREQKMTVQPQVIPVTSSGPGELYQGGAWVYAPRQYQKICMMITERTAGGAFIEQTASCIYVQQPRHWEHIHVRWESRTAGHSFTVAVQQRGPRTGDWFDVDDLTLTAGSYPLALTSPSMTGTAQVGHTLTVDAGTWTNGPVTIEYDWFRCHKGYACVQLQPTVNSPTYVVQPTDVGWYISAGGLATNAVGYSGWFVPDTPPVIP